MDGLVWQAAVGETDLSEADRQALRDACRRDPDLGEHLDYVLPHLTLNLSGDFLHHLVRELESSHEVAVINALVQTIGTPGPELRARLAKGREEADTA